ncbi:MAG: outer membrane beta-barrel protein [Pseudomonadota bacterium]
MRYLGIAAVAFAATGSSALADGHAEKCFDKGALTYVDCPKPEPAPAPAPVVAAPAAPAYVWAGPYIGLHAGYAEADFNGDYDGGDRTGAIDIDDTDVSGLILGGQVGYNFNVASNTLMGVELDASYFGDDDTVSEIDQPGDAPQSVSSEVEWFGSLRLRLGQSFGRVMPFVTGGVGLVNYEYDIVDTGGSVTPAGGYSSSNSETVFAPVVGGGVELFALKHWTLRAEGMYYFIDENDDLQDLADMQPNDGEGHSFDDLWTVRGALNYKF